MILHFKKVHITITHFKKTKDASTFWLDFYTPDISGAFWISCQISHIISLDSRKLSRTLHYSNDWFQRGEPSAGIRRCAQGPKIGSDQLMVQINCLFRCFSHQGNLANSHKRNNKTKLATANLSDTNSCSKSSVMNCTDQEIVILFPVNFQILNSGWLRQGLGVFRTLIICN